MTLPSWPQAIHYEPEQNTLQEEPNTGVSRSAMDQGPVMSRNRFTNQPIIHTFVWYFTGTEYEVFKSWHKFTLVNGTRWFWNMVWTGSQYAAAKCQFLEDYKSNSTGVEDTRVSSKLQVKGLLILDEAAAWFVGTYGPEFTLSFSDQLQIIVNVDMPLAFQNY
jgi:hypothetical protein